MEWTNEHWCWWPSLSLSLYPLFLLFSCVLIHSLFFLFHEPSLWMTKKTLWSWKETKIDLPWIHSLSSSVLYRPWSMMIKDGNFIPNLQIVPPAGMRQESVPAVGPFMVWISLSFCPSCRSLQLKMSGCSSSPNGEARGQFQSFVSSV